MSDWNKQLYGAAQSGDVEAVSEELATSFADLADSGLDADRPPVAKSSGLVL